MKKKVKYFTLLLVFFIGISLIYSNNVYAGNLKIKDLNLTVQVNEDASMDVIEKWKIEIEDTNTLFKSFDIDKSKYSSIDNVSVKDLTNNRTFTQINQEMYHVTSQYV